MKRAIPLQQGTGEDTWNDIVIVSDQQYNDYQLEQEEPQEY